MKLKPPAYIMAIVLLLMSTDVWADQIMLRDGTVYSGKFIRGDSKIVEFRVLGRVESFKTTDISEIVFKESEQDVAEKAAAGTPSSSPASDSAAAERIKPDAAPAVERPRIRATRPATEALESRASSLTIPAGMAITVRTATEIDTDRNRVGDYFEAALDSDLMAGTQIAVSRGAFVKGRISYAEESGKLAGRSQLALELLEITVNGKTYPIRTSDYVEVGSSRGTKTAQTVGGTAALGAIIGAIAGGGKGAAIGAASGAAVGTGVQVITRGEVLRVPAETILEFKLQSALTIDAP